MSDKTYSCSLPGQSVSIYANEPKKLLGIGINDQAIRSASAFLTIGFDKRQARELMTDFIEAYEKLYGEPFRLLEDTDDTQRI